MDNSSKFPKEPRDIDFFREEGMYAPVPDVAVNYRKTSRERGAKIFWNRVKAVGAIVLFGAGAGYSLSKYADTNTDRPTPTTTTELKTTGTTIAIPDEPGEGYQSLVEEEAAISNVSIDWDTTQRLVSEAEALNKGKQPRLNEGIALPDIPNAPPTTIAPTAP